jgi:hypothetical protein
MALACGGIVVCVAVGIDVAVGIGAAVGVGSCARTDVSAISNSRTAARLAASKDRHG